MIPFPQGPRIIERKLPNGRIHHIAVIPSRISDNRILLERDPDYPTRIQMVGTQLAKAWLDGDWTAIEGAYFECWSEAMHVVPPFEVPKDWIRLRSGDWGSNSPFSFGWWAVVQDDFTIPDDIGPKVNAVNPEGRAYSQRGPSGRTLPRGALVRYREWYGARGGKLTNEALGAGIAAREKDDPKLMDAVLDPSTFKEDGGPSASRNKSTTCFCDIN